MIDEAIRPLGSDDFHEIGTAHLEIVIDEALKLGSITDGEMPFEDHAVKTRKSPGNQTGKLGGERAYCLHGIRFQNECW